MAKVALHNGYSTLGKGHDIAGLEVGAHVAPQHLSQVIAGGEQMGGNGSPTHRPLLLPAQLRQGIHFLQRQDEVASLEGTPLPPVLDVVQLQPGRAQICQSFPP
jgi:hypothetical protein